MISRFIKVSTQTEFIHQYLDAPEDVSFLRYPHRHMLHITVTIEVFTDDRELEFIMVKRALDEILTDLRLTVCSNRSCEMIGGKILTNLEVLCGSNRDITIEVSEDGENGSIIKYTKEEEV